MRDAYDDHLTCGCWTNEADSTAALDEILAAIGLFQVHREVCGSYLFMLPGSDLQAARIDRLLIPTPELKTQGWTHGPIGIECKSSGTKLGRPLAQILDYSRVAWRIGETYVVPRFYFLWPMSKVHGPLASVLAHNRIGGAHTSPFTLLQLSCGEQVIARFNQDGSHSFKSADFGRKVGSR